MYETPEKDNSCKHIPGRLVFNRISARSHKVDVVQVIQTIVHENEWVILVVQSVGMFPKGSTEKKGIPVFRETGHVGDSYDININVNNPAGYNVHMSAI